MDFSKVTIRLKNRFTPKKDVDYITGTLLTYDDTNTALGIDTSNTVYNLNIGNNNTAIGYYGLDFIPTTNDFFIPIRNDNTNKINVYYEANGIIRIKIIGNVSLLDTDIGEYNAIEAENGVTFAILEATGDILICNDISQFNSNDTHIHIENVKFMDLIAFANNH